jgi:hypothetical protein
MVLAGLLGLVQGLRCGAASWICLRLECGSAGDQPGISIRALSHASRAWALYPHNAHLCQWVAEKALYDGPGPDGLPEQRRLRIAALWCGRGLALMPRNRVLLLAHTRMLQRSDPAGAAAFWSRYVEWHFWDPFNHAVLAGLLARSGDFAGALKALELTAGSRWHEVAGNEVREAWERERRTPGTDGQP